MTNSARCCPTRASLLTGRNPHSVGVGIIAGLAYNAARDVNLTAISAGHLFGTNLSRVALKEGAYLRGYVFTFIELLAPSLSRKLVEQVLAGQKDSYEL